MSDEPVTIESLARMAEALKPQPQGDKPRKVIVCNPDEYDAIQRCVVHDLGHRDVLVKPNRLIDPGQAYVIDGDVFALCGGSAIVPFEDDTYIQCECVRKAS